MEIEAKEVLTPCPFCGSQKAVRMTQEGPVVGVRCVEDAGGCGAGFALSIGEATREKAAVRWNQRVPQEIPLEKVVVGADGFRHADISPGEAVAALTEIVRFKNAEKINVAALGTRVIQLLSGWEVKSEEPQAT